MADLPADRILKDTIDEVWKPRLVDHGWYIANADDEPFPITRAELLYVWDQYGTQYLDFSGGRENVLGHNNPAVTSFLIEQLGHHGYVGRVEDTCVRTPVEYANLLAESLRTDAHTPFQVQFFSDEQQAYDAGIQLGFDRSTNAPLVLNLVNDGIPMDPRSVVADVETARSQGLLVVVDETLTGFGRTGMQWGQQRWGFEADITIVGGPAGGGFPFGAVIARHGLFGPEPSPRGSGNPLICAAGMTVFKEIHTGLCEHVTQCGQTLNEALVETRNQFPEVLATSRGAGLLQVLECRDEDVAAGLVKHARRNGLLIPKARGKKIWLTPPLVISENEVRRGVDMLAAACLDLTEG